MWSHTALFVTSVISTFIDPIAVKICGFISLCSLSYFLVISCKYTEGPKQKKTTLAILSMKYTLRPQWKIF